MEGEGESDVNQYWIRPVVDVAVRKHDKAMYLCTI